MNLEPLVFTNGQQFFDSLKDNYITHEKGLFIMTPSGAGKTHFCKRQTEPHWIDGDDLWMDSGAQPRFDPSAIPWWESGVPVIERVEQRCDVITAQAMDRGFWIMGSVNFWLQPSAIVIPDWDTLTRQIKMRQEGGAYDGGLKEEHHEQLKAHIRIIERWHTNHGVPKFASIDEAVQALINDL